MQNAHDVSNCNATISSDKSAHVSDVTRSSPSYASQPRARLPDTTRANDTSVVSQADSIQFIRRSLPEIARNLSSRLRVDIKEGDIDGKKGLQINIWELSDTPAQGISQEGRPNSRQNYEFPANEQGTYQDFQNHQQLFSSIKKFFEEGPESPPLLQQNIDVSLSKDIFDQGFGNLVYSVHEECADTKATMIRTDDIPQKPRGNCLFYSLIKACKLNISALDLRKKLLDSPFIETCGNDVEAVRILSSPTEFGNVDCAYIFASVYTKNICIHFRDDNDKYTYCRTVVASNKPFIHLHLANAHYTPYIPIAMATIESAESHKIATREQDDTGNEMLYESPDEVRSGQHQNKTSPVDQLHQQNYDRAEKSVDRQSENSLQLNEKCNEVVDRLSVLKRSNDQGKQCEEGEGK
ncbi:hypothetical protein TKK_0010010 [Trichogramma kaykai]|uniref:OTU domain-containing protein n=1 Tax=Trichogramma kaykai TaxID=54128 RepID=A0ABD2WZP4_9HYME